MPDQTPVIVDETATTVTPAEIAEMRRALASLEAAWWRAVGEPQPPPITDLVWERLPNGELCPLRADLTVKR
jgi:hypothetical protein